MKPGVLWIGIVVGLLATSVLIHGALLVFASIDPGFALEPDYERKAAQWDERRRQESASDRLGWTAELRTTPASTPGEVEVALRLADGDGAALDGATVTVETFHVARARHVLRATLEGEGAGVYGATLPIRPSGIWEFRLAVTRGADHYVRTIRKDVLSTPRRGAGRTVTALIVTIFLASVMGSLHCAGMCGAFVALAMGTGEQRGIRHALVQSAYHGGRLLTYALLGALAVALGAGLDLTGAVFGVQRVALAVAGGAMIVFGIATLLRLQGVRWRALKLPPPIVRLVGRGHRFAVERPPIVRALIIGLLSTFLPCGWLYAFAVAAAGTGSASLGALSMAVFWLGTLPVLISIGLGVQRLAGPLRRHVPAAAALALVIVGALAIGGRFRVPALTAPAAWAHDGATGADAVVEHVRTIDADGMPCCGGSE